MKHNQLLFNPLKSKKFWLWDIETYNPINEALPYDISVIGFQGKKIIYKKVLLSKLIFTNTELESNVYFKNKLISYWDKMLEDKGNKTHYYELLDNLSICLRLNDIIEDNDIKTITGYNVGFDYEAINRLYDKVNNNITILRKHHKLLGMSYKDIPRKVYNGFKKVNYYDLYTTIVNLLEDNPELRLEYYIFCVVNHLYTDSLKCISSTEETMHNCFIDFGKIEAHIGLEDCEDEFELLKWTQHQIKKGKLKTLIKLNTKVSKACYGKYGLFGTHRVLRELKKANVDIDLTELEAIVATHK